jgi:hypothetical protein
MLKITIPGLHNKIINKNHYPYDRMKTLPIILTFLPGARICKAAVPLLRGVLELSLRAGLLTTQINISALAPINRYLTQLKRNQSLIERKQADNRN